MVKKFISVIFIALFTTVAVVLGGGFRFSIPGKNISEAIPSGEKSGTKTKNLSSFFTNKADYDSAFSSAANIDKRKVLAGITSHHFLAKDLIARFFSGIDASGVRNVILVGPDHRGALDIMKKDAVTTKLSWDTPYGQLDPEKELQDRLLVNGDIVENDSIFKIEHSIYTLIPFVKKSFPEARVAPFIIRNNNEYDKFVGLGNDARKFSESKTLLIVSSDFSHDATSVEAEKNDRASIEILKNLNEKNIGGIVSDCKSCIAFLHGFLGSDLNDFYLAEDKNSFDFGSQDEKFTSYISGYYLGGNESDKNNIISQ